MANKPSSDDGAKSVIFETFETSATCERVLAAENALQWDFPGQAVAIPHETLLEEDFQQSFCTFLEQASIESIKHFAAVTYKACAPQPEIRDTPTPVLVTGALMAILEANGSIHNTTLLRKRVRDTVSFDTAHKPWRRSAFYLVLRVAMQRHLYNLLGADKGRLYYKVIMCIFLSQLLRDGLYALPNEASHLLLQKLGRRLAKLELDHDRGSTTYKKLHSHVFRTLRSVFEKSLASATGSIELQWDVHKRRTARITVPIQPYANHADMTLRLPRSSQSLNQAMHLRFSTASTEVRSPDDLLGHYESTTALKPFIAIMARHLSLCAHEDALIETYTKARPNNSTSCVDLAREIEAYVSTVQDAYWDYPELMSRQLLNTLELWMIMDRHAVNCYPLLAQYHPGIEAAMLNALQLSTLDEFRRLHDLQIYISKRCHGWNGRGTKTIFDLPADDSFAVRYFNESSDAAALLELRTEIEKDAEKDLAAKEEEWQETSAIHESKMREIAELSCVYTIEVDERGIEQQVHKKPCRKHKLKWEAKQMMIEVLEHPLPKFEPALKAVIFELMCPDGFAAYRDATWLILSSFAFPRKTPGTDTPLIDEAPLLRAYPGLEDYANDVISRVTLASSTKSHLESHYAKSGFPVTFRGICRSFGLKLEYYDIATEVFIGTHEEPSFAHLFPMKLPANSPYMSFEEVNDNWPTSNRVLATQTRCPADVNVHEYMAWQSLLSGTYSRWPSLLRELGSTNLSFSTDSTWAAVSRLILQAGPADSDDTLRDTHSILHDVVFCRQLLEQIDYRLEAIRRNWREPVQLDILISLLLKIRTCAPSTEIRTTCMTLLSKSRNITQAWCAGLCSVENEHESDPSVFVVWAAVLRKRTFYPSMELPYIPSQLLVDFIVASVTLQNSLAGNFNILPYNLRNAVLRDLRSMYSIRALIEDAMYTEKPLLESLRAFWPVPPDCEDRPIHLYHLPHPCWVLMTLSTSDKSEHHIHYNYVEGTLLIDGHPLGVLPSEYRRWPIVQELFGSQVLRMYPSALPGMSIVVDRQMPSGHWVHLGFRNDSLVIRATHQITTHQNTLLELVSRNIFGNRYHFDLPATLALNCYHWLDLNTGIVEIRQQDPWKSKKGNWRLNLTTRQATRNNGSTLVDPNSELARRVVQNFHLFELPHNITVYQPPRGRLRVELKRLELDFIVTQSGLLLCPQLGAVIVETRSQDIGTWYGLKSKLVVRSIKDHTQRSILVPFGEPLIEREGSHVSVVIMNKGEYLKFSVNNELGRIDCPAEPVMLYYRALLHALTTYFLPDTLTNCTGAEEALRYLQSGAYRPWTPLSSNACDILLRISQLSPSRVYYPTELKSMESVQWKHEFTITMQDDRYRRVVETIMHRNSQVTQFAHAAVARSVPSCASGDEHLENRAIYRSGFTYRGHDSIYTARDSRVDGLERSNASDMATLLCRWPSHFTSTRKLASLLEDFSIIGGYVRDFDKIQLSDILHAEIGEDWGALVNTVSKLSYKDRFQLTFLFSVLAFSSSANMDLLRAIISFSILPDLRCMPRPNVPAYSRFQSNEAPELDSLVASMRGAILPYVVPEGTPPGQLWMRQMDHEKDAIRACRTFAESICAQWPSKTIDLGQLTVVKDTLFDRDEAFELVLPTWNRLVQNFAFSQHIEEVQLALTRHDVDVQAQQAQPVLLIALRPQIYPLRMRGGDRPSLQDILEKDLGTLLQHSSSRRVGVSATHTLVNRPNGHMNNAPIIGSVTAPKPSNYPKNSRKQNEASRVRELSKIIAPFRNSQSMVHRRYGVELEHSIKALADHLAKPEAHQEPFNPTKLTNDLFAAKELARTIREQIQLALRKGDLRAKWLHMVGLWPRVTPFTLLTELRSTSGAKLGVGVKEILVDFGVAITQYQRLLRLHDAVQKDRRQQIDDERNNVGHTNWSPLEFVDWLLLEIESNFMIRTEQVDVALGTISPASQQNSVLQLLMGKGKTSCILPMVALVLSSGNLFRIVVPRPLLLQSAQIMQAKLGGLLNREILHVPFSRKTPTDKALMQTYCGLHTYMQKQNGIVLALPEHILSFKLSGLQRLCDGKVEEATMMIKAQAWLDRHARDVLDECDVSLAIRTQLIYPSGSQQTVDGHPLRWQTIQALLDLISSYLDDLIHKYPHSIEVVSRTGFPLIYFLRPDVEEYLVKQIVQKICKGQTAILPISDYSPSAQNDIHKFISVPLVDAEVTTRVLLAFSEKRHLIDVVYHLRGLFIHRILLSTLKKRWNVQYGLHPTRDPIAVPYQVRMIASSTDTHSRTHIHSRN